MKPTSICLRAAALLFALWIAFAAEAAPTAIKRVDTTPTHASATATSTLQVGALTLRPCGPACCGSLVRAPDPAGEIAGDISIGLEFYPPRNPALPVAGAIVAT